MIKTKILSSISDFTTLAEVKALIAKGEDVNARDNNGATPLMRSAWNDDPEIAELLLKEGARLEARDRSGYTPLIHSVRHNNPAVLSVLLEAGANINARDRFGRKALICAMESDSSLETIRILVDEGAAIETRDEDLRTPLMAASIWNDNPEVIKVLLAAGADIFAKDKYGQTPLMAAKAYKQNAEIIEILTEAETEKARLTHEAYKVLIKSEECNKLTQAIRALMGVGESIIGEVWEVVKHRRKELGETLYWEINDICCEVLDGKQYR